MGMGFPFKAVKCFETRQRWSSHNLVNVLNATKLYIKTFKWLDLCHINFTSIFKKRILVLGNHVFQFYMCVAVLNQHIFPPSDCSQQILKKYHPVIFDSLRGNPETDPVLTKPWGEEYTPIHFCTASVSPCSTHFT